MADLDAATLARVVDALPVAVGLLRPVHGADGQVDDLMWEHLNPSLQSLLHGPVLVGEKVGRRIGDQYEGLLQRYIATYETGVELNQRVSVSGETATGHFDLTARRLGDHVLLQVADVTQLVEAASAENEALQRVADTLERINDGVYSFDEDWRFTFVNAEAGRVLGWDPAELIGRHASETFPDAIGTEIERYFQHAVTYEESVSFEAYYPAPLDTWYHVRAYPGPDGLTAFFQDIGVRRRIEERAAELERLESIATLAGGVAHDFNNLLMVISGHASLLDEGLPADDDQREDVAAIRAATERATALTNQLLSFGRSQVLQPAVVDLNAAVEQLEPTLRAAVPVSVRVVVRPAAEPALVDVDRSELDRAVLHLATNAAQAMPDGGTLVVEVDTVHVDAAHALAHPERRPGWYGVVTVSDTGAGMSQAVLRRAIEPFFTTKEGAGASGLGLSAVDGMARQAGGHLSLYSEPGIGTSARLCLPRSTADVSDDPVAPGDRAGSTPADGPVRSRRETVLVVDDNESVRTLMDRILSDLGYEVLVAADQASGREVATAHADRIELVVTDVVMPGGSGPGLVADLKAVLPDVPVLFVSGYPQSSVTDGQAGFLLKPFGPHELSDAVRAILDRADPRP